MEERKLNFNAPLLSVRRSSAITVASSDGENRKIILSDRRYNIPFYKSDLNLEQVTEPAAVPFLWEQIPGRPKDDVPEPRQLEEASVTPRLPPQRDLDIVKYPLKQEVKNRPKVESCSMNDNEIRLDCSKEGNEGKEDLDLENDDDDVYSDALDTLSLTDSFSMNCSVSGLSGSEGQVIKRSGMFSTDPQARDFMMNRFLSAAKAMALEPPQYASRKKLVAVEQPRQVIEVVSEDRMPLLNESIVIPHYGEDVDEEESEYVDEEESEDEVDEYDDSGNLSSKGCGLFPRLCSNKSLCLLNAEPALKVRSNSSMSSISQVRKLGKAAYVESHRQNVKKPSRYAFYKHQSDSGVQSPKLQGIENKVTCGSNRFTYSNNQQMKNRSSPHRPGISPYRNERPQSPFRGVGFLGIPKEAENLRAARLNFYGKASSKSHELLSSRWNLYNKSSSKSQELLSHQSFKEGSGSLSPTVEKTLYVDTVNFAKMSFSDSNSSDTEGQMDSVVRNFDTSTGSREIEQSACAESSLQYVSCLNLMKGGSILETRIPGSVKANQSYFTEILHPGGQPDKSECFRLDGELDRECKSLECVKVIADGNLMGSSEHNLEVFDPGYINNGFAQSLLSPPLPKKPSESWLWRDRPSVSSQSPFSYSYNSSYVHPKKQDPYAHLTTTKWETIVKTSYSHHDHVSYSEELTAHFSQQSNS